MIPIRDTIRSRTFPLVTWLIIAANTLVFFYEQSLSPSGLESFIVTFAVIPAKIQLFNPLTWYPLLTHQFLHGGWFHFLSNMWILYIFGDNIEDRLGSGRYLLFYLLGGTAAGMVQVFFSPGSSTPALGASGAIAAVMGGYFFFYPTARVITLVLLFIFPWFVEIPAVVYLGFWFISQIFSGVLALATPSGVAGGGVAWWAHIGGFLFGLLLARPFMINRRYPPWNTDEYYPW